MIPELALLQVAVTLDSGSAVGIVEVSGVIDLVLEVVAVLDQGGLVKVAHLLDPGFELVDHGFFEVVVLDPHSAALDIVLDQEGLVEESAALDLVLEVLSVLDLVLEVLAVPNQEGLVQVVAVLDLLLDIQLPSMTRTSTGCQKNSDRNK